MYPQYPDQTIKWLYIIDSNKHQLYVKLVFLIFIYPSRNISSYPDLFLNSISMKTHTYARTHVCTCACMHACMHAYTHTEDVNIEEHRNSLCFFIHTAQDLGKSYWYFS